MGFILDAAKVCSRCERSLPRTEFHARAASPDGLQGHCKGCERARTRNPVERKRTNQKDYARHREARREAGRSWYRANSAKAIANQVQHVARRRALKRLADVRLVPKKDWARLVARYGGLCAYCGDRPWEHQDHIIPLSRGGRHAIGNLLPSCGLCNTSKGPLLLIEWRRRWA